MNILFLALDVNLVHRTGDSIHVRELATSLTKLGNDVFLITTHTDIDNSSLDWAKKVPNLHLFFNEPRRKFKNISTFIFCKKIAKKYHLEIIYERRNSPKIGVFLGKLLRIPAVIEINGLPEEEAEMLGISRKEKSILRPIKGSIFRYLIRSVDSIVTVTPGIRREIIKKYDVQSNRISVIENGANVNLFRPMDQKICREKLGLNKKAKYVCFVGNLAPWQGIEYLIKSSSLIVEKEANARFIIIGYGVIDETLRGMVNDINMSDRFLFTGRTPYEKVPLFINASNVCVAPFIRARNEKIGLSPLKIYEYLACGKPVVASDIEGVGTFLREAKSGIAVEPENHEELAESILRLLQNEDISKEMGEKGREIVTQKHSWDTAAKKVMEVCRFLT